MPCKSSSHFHLLQVFGRITHLEKNNKNCQDKVGEMLKKTGQKSFRLFPRYTLSTSFNPGTCQSGIPVNAFETANFGAAAPTTFLAQFFPFFRCQADDTSLPENFFFEALGNLFVDFFQQNGSLPATVGSLIFFVQHIIIIYLIFQQKTPNQI